MYVHPKETYLLFLVTVLFLTKYIKILSKIMFFSVKMFYICHQRPTKALRNRSSAFNNRLKPSSNMLKASINNKVIPDAYNKH